jgi:hypothetical protein
MVLVCGVKQVERRDATDAVGPLINSATLREGWTGKGPGVGLGLPVCEYRDNCGTHAVEKCSSQC